MGTCVIILGKGILLSVSIWMGIIIWLQGEDTLNLGTLFIISMGKRFRFLT